MKHLLHLIAIISASLCYAQSFTGQVLDAESKEGIPFATIALPDTDNGIACDEKGFFTIDDYPRKFLRLQISSVGYESQVDEIDLTTIIQKDFLLEPSHFELKELIISFPSGKLSDENVVEVEKKTLSLISGSSTINLTSALTSIPGVDQVSTGSGIGKPVIRGLSGNRIVTYTQGIRLENQQFGDEHGLGENAIGINRVEVIKGPASLLYGADALGGVLYLVDESYAPMNATEAFVATQFLSNTKTFNNSAGLKVNKKGLKWNAFGAYNNSADYKVPNGNRVLNTRFDELSLKSSLGYNKKNWVGNLRFGHLKNQFGIPEGNYSMDKSRSVELPSQKVEQNNLSLENVYFLDRNEISLIAGYSSNRRKEFEEDMISPALDMKLTNLTYNLKATIDPSSKTLQVVSGIQGMRRENVNLGEEVLIPDAITNDFGVYSMLNLSGNSSYELQGGLRFDHRQLSTLMFADEDKTIPELDRSFSSVNFSAGSSYMWDRVEVKLNLASGFRPPNTAELLSDGQHEGTLRYERGNANLVSEQAFQTDLSMQFENEHLTIGLNPFFNQINNYIFLAPTANVINGDPVFSYQQTDAMLYGAEFGIHFHPHAIHWLHIESNYSGVFAEDRQGQSLPLIPANRIHTKLSVELFTRKKLSTNIYLEQLNKFDQKRVTNLETKSAAYQLTNVGLSLEHNSIGFEMGIDNLFNTEYIDHLSRLKSDNIPNAGRNVFIGTKFDF